MANLQKFRTHEALNTTSAAGWNQLSRDVIGGSAGDAINAGSVSAATNTIHVPLTAGTNQLLVYSDGNIYFTFSAGEGQDVVHNNSLVLPGSALTSIAVPLGLQTGNETMYFNFNSTTTTLHVVRIVEV